VAASSEQDVEQSTESRQTLLCLNDNETALWVRKLVLEKEGFKVLTATEAHAALELMSREHVDLVVTDHILSDTTGLQVSHELKRCWPKVPIILLSGVVEAPDDIRPADAFVSKLDGREVLVAKIRELLK
jgi:DNA-binding response OmpR family regulator